MSLTAPTPTADPIARLSGHTGMAVALLVLPLAGLVVALRGPAMGLALIVLLMAVYTCVRMPGVLFAAYLLLPLYKGAAQPMLPIDLTVVLSILVMLQAIPILRDPRPRAISVAGVLLWTALALLLLGGVLYAPDQAIAIDRAARWWLLAFLPILVGAVRVGSDIRYVRQLLWTFFIAGAVTVVLGLTQFSELQRLTVLEANTIQVARGALLVPIVGFTFVLQQRRLLAEVALAFLTPASIVIAVASGSRGPLLFVVLLGLVGLIRFVMGPRTIDPRTKRTLQLMAAISVISLVVVVPILPSASLLRFELLGDFVSRELGDNPIATATDNSSEVRVRLFGVAASMFAERPLLGYGTAGFEAISPTRLPPMEAAAWPHNALIQTAAEFGVVGLCLVGGLLFLALTRRRAGVEHTSLLVITAFFLLNAMVSGDIFTDRETWGLVMLLLMIEVPRALPWSAASAVATPHGPPGPAVHSSSA